MCTDSMKILYHFYRRLEQPQSLVPVVKQRLGTTPLWMTVECL